MVFLEAAFATVPFVVSTLRAITTTNALANFDFLVDFISNPHLSLSYCLLLTRESSRSELAKNSICYRTNTSLTIPLITFQGVFILWVTFQGVFIPWVTS